MDSLFCGKATAVATCHWHVAKCRLSSPLSECHTKIKATPCGVAFILVDDNGLEPLTLRTSSACSTS